MPSENIRDDSECDGDRQGDRPQAISSNKPITLSQNAIALYHSSEISLQCVDRTYTPAPFCANKYYL